jgi:hypothetical protein
MDVLSIQVVSDYRELVGLVGSGSCGVVLHRRGRSQAELHGQLASILNPTSISLPSDRPLVHLESRAGQRNAHYGPD